jgi:hypothetical protein
VRIRGWSFGFGHVFGALGKFVKVLKKPLGRLGKKNKE